MSASMGRRDFLGTIGTVAASATALAGALPQWASAADKKAKPKRSKEMLRVAMLSGWHAHAKGYADRFKKMENVKIAAVWDENPERGQTWANELAVPFEKDLNATMKRRDVDAVAVCAPTSMHADIMIAAAKAKKHIFAEKVMALTVDECKRIADAVHAANVKFCISFPYRTRAETLYAYKAVQDGLIGQLTFIRVRVAHDAGSAGWLPPHFWDAATCGGGAMMDLGAHPMYLARWLGGQPKRISSMFTYLTGHEVEDNAVSVIEFENKVLGVTETGFVSKNSPFALELSGTEGSLVVGGPQDKKVAIRAKKVSEKEEWVTPAELPEALPHPTQMWVDGILKNAPIPFGIEEGTQLTELMQYAYVAHRERRQVEIPSR